MTLLNQTTAYFLNGPRFAHRVGTLWVSSFDLMICDSNTMMEKGINGGTTSESPGPKVNALSTKPPLLFDWIIRMVSSQLDKRTVGIWLWVYIKTFMIWTSGQGSADNVG